MLASLLYDEEGLTSVEYALMLMVMVVGVTVVFGIVGSRSSANAATAGDQLPPR